MAGGGCFEALAHDGRALLRPAQGRREQPAAIILDSQSPQSTPEGGHRAGDAGHKRKPGSRVQMAADTLGDWLALPAAPANEQDRAQVAALAQDAPEATAKKTPIPFGQGGLNASK